jgi:hypothetical protein
MRTCVSRSDTGSREDTIVSLSLSLVLKDLPSLLYYSVNALLCLLIERRVVVLLAANG